MMAVFAVTSFVAGGLYARLGPKLIVSAGAVCLTLGAFLISLIERDSGFTALVPGMVIMGIGVGLFYSSITTAAVTALDPSRSSLAGGIVYMFQVAGGSVGLGLTTTVFITASEDKLQEAWTPAGCATARSTLCTAPCGHRVRRGDPEPLLDRGGGSRPRAGA